MFKPDIIFVKSREIEKDYYWVNKDTSDVYEVINSEFEENFEESGGPFEGANRNILKCAMKIKSDKITLMLSDIYLKRVDRSNNLIRLTAILQFNGFDSRILTIFKSAIQREINSDSPIIKYLDNYFLSNGQTEELFPEIEAFMPKESISDYKITSFHGNWNDENVKKVINEYLSGIARNYINYDQFLILSANYVRGEFYKRYQPKIVCIYRNYFPEKQNLPSSIQNRENKSSSKMIIDDVREIGNKIYFKGSHLIQEIYKYKLSLGLFFLVIILAFLLLINGLFINKPSPKKNNRILLNYDYIIENSDFENKGIRIYDIHKQLLKKDNKIYIIEIK